MALLHATQLASVLVNTVGSPPQLLYTVPAGNRIILRSISGRNFAGSANQLKIIQDGSTVITIFLAAGGSSGDSVEARRWMVFTPGQKIQANVTVAAGAYVVLSGSIYTI